MERYGVERAHDQRFGDQGSGAAFEYPSNDYVEPDETLTGGYQYGEHADIDAEVAMELEGVTDPAAQRELLRVKKDDAMERGDNEEVARLDAVIALHDRRHGFIQ